MRAHRENKVHSYTHIWTDWPRMEQIKTLLA